VARTSLVEAAVVPQPSWWRRLRNRAGKRPAAAGTRPGRKRRQQAAARTGGGRGTGLPRVLSRVGALLVVVAVIVGVAVPGLRDQVTKPVRDLYHRFTDDDVQVTVTAATASSSTPGHSAGALVDNDTATWWAAAGAGKGQKITLTLTTPTTLSKFGIYAGAAGKSFPGSPRPAKVRVRADDGTSVDVDVRDEEGRQLTSLTTKRPVHTVTVEVLAVRPGQQRLPLAVTELLLYGKGA